MRIIYNHISLSAQNISNGDVITLEKVQPKYSRGDIGTFGSHETSIGREILMNNQATK